MAERPNRSELRNAISESLAFHVKAYDLPDACGALALDVRSSDDDPMSSKRIYVRHLLFSKSRDDLIAIARSVADEYGDDQLGKLVGATGIQGVDGELKNLIFAANGPKPRIVLRDAVNNVIEIVENGQFCLTYDRQLSADGLTWGELVDWWREEHDPNAGDRLGSARRLYMRLSESLVSPPERLLLEVYARRYAGTDSDASPALIPQVYLHYDPYTRAELGIKGEALTRQRMDFLLLLRGGARVVIEIDGRQHYTQSVNSSVADPARYATMVEEDRSLRLRGYEVYRFGGAEFQAERLPEKALERFFEALLERHS